MNRRVRLASAIVVGGVASGLLSLPSIGGNSAATAQSAPDIRDNYLYKPLKMGAGGFVTGLAINPASPDRIFARTDVGGAYRWNPDTRTWTQLVTVQSVKAPPPQQPNAYERATKELLDTDYSIESLAITPANPNVVVIAAGGEICCALGRILRSTDGGQTFTVGTQKFTMAGNSESGRRTGAERLQLDPRNALVGFFATRRNGLQKTADGGATWTQIPTSTIPFGSGDAGVRFVEYDPSSPLVNGQTQRAYIGVEGDGIYEHNTTNGAFTKIDSSLTSVIDVSLSSDGKFWVSSGNRIKVWNPANRTWTDRTPPGSVDQLVVVDPKNPQRLFVGNGGLRDGEFWRSLDAGSTWTSVNIALAAARIPWLSRSGEEGYMTAGRFVFHPNGELWFAQGAGVWTTSDLADGEVTWTENSDGIEELVTSDIVAPPGGRPVTAVADFHGFLHDNVDVYPSKMFIGQALGTNTGLDYSGGNPQVVVAAGATTNLANIGCGYVSPCNGLGGISRDGGRSWTPFGTGVRSAPGAVVEDGKYVLTAGNVSVSADARTLLWIPANNRPPSSSTDGGATWTKVSGLANKNINPRFVLSRRATDSDKVAADTFYVTVQTANGWVLATTRDAARTWTEGQPFAVQPDSFTVHGQVRAAPGKAGHVWASGAFGGLSRSTDYGATMRPVAGVDAAFNFGFGAPAPGASYPTIFAHASVNGTWGIWRSIDEGTSWQLIGDYPLGIYDPITVVQGDMNVFGRVYVGFSGNGFAYGDDTGTPPVPVSTVPQTATPTPTRPAPTTTATAPTTTATTPTTATPTTTTPTTTPPITGAPTVCVGNRVVNPGFEDGLTGWTSWGGNDAIVSDARSGSSAFKVGGRGQNVSVTPGESLRASVWAKAKGSGWSSVGLDFFTPTERIPGKQQRVTSASYTEVTLGVTVPSDATNAVVWAWSSDETLIVDDWCVR